LAFPSQSTNCQPLNILFSLTASNSNTLTELQYKDSCSFAIKVISCSDYRKISRIAFSMLKLKRSSYTYRFSFLFQTCIVVIPKWSNFHCKQWTSESKSSCSDWSVPKISRQRQLRRFEYEVFCSYHIVGIYLVAITLYFTAATRFSQIYKIFKSGNTRNFQRTQLYKSFQNLQGYIFRIL
jgi:hypothetical protein